MTDEAYSALRAADFHFPYGEKQLHRVHVRQHDAIFIAFILAIELDQVGVVVANVGH